MSLTEGCVEALKEVFHRIDLDGNGCISRMEFDFFQEMTSGESCDDDAWKVIQGQYKFTCMQYCMHVPYSGKISRGPIWRSFHSKLPN